MQVFAFEQDAIAQTSGQIWRQLERRFDGDVVDARIFYLFNEVIH